MQSRTLWAVGSLLSKVKGHDCTFWFLMAADPRHHRITSSSNSAFGCSHSCCLSPPSQSWRNAGCFHSRNLRVCSARAQSQLVDILDSGRQRCGTLADTRHKLTSFLNYRAQTRPLTLSHGSPSVRHPTWSLQKLVRTWSSCKHLTP